MEHCTYKITITGTVQGVGFRPFVYALSQRYLLTGTVSNTSLGVIIIVNSDTFTPQQFMTALEFESPLLASIEKIVCEEITFEVFEGFEIVQTQESGDVTVNIPPDINTCKSCETELLDPLNRRYKYPFITCTQCGVRYSIVQDLPYDRKNTSMKFFALCTQCEEEYNNPLDRRYHAQPIGCWDCGPQLKLIKEKETLALAQSSTVETVISLLKEGNIIAIKGVGGYHLMCDATNDLAVSKLRKRKNRARKPFAVMVKDLHTAKELATVSADEATLLCSKERPIVLLNAIKNDLSVHISPNISRVGLFLPYTPLHLLILEGLNTPLVATSANLSDEPICTNKNDLENLEGVYDYILDHDREILNACDDSVVMMVEDKRVTLRRARGYAPSSIELPGRVQEATLALGANQKSSVAIAFDNKVILSPHIGDLNSISSVDFYKKSIETLKRIYKFNPQHIVYDKHPHYESTKVAQEMLTSQKELSSLQVQHHYAHILGVMAENKLKQDVFGVAFDGTGFGDDGKLWGGEFLRCNYNEYTRVSHIKYFKLLGAHKAIKEPKRIALSFLFELYGESAIELDNAVIKEFSNLELRTYYKAWVKEINTPLSSSMGRVFDGVASLLDICHMMSFEGESGMLLEEYYDDTVKEFYPLSYEDDVIDIFTMIEELLKESDKTVAVSKFFNTIVEMIAVLYKPYDIPLVLSGGVFQNRVLLGLVLKRFPGAIIPSIFPPNDGGIALGQAVYGLLVE